MIELDYWRKYFSNQLTNSEKFELEKKDLKDPCLSDAFEFYSENGFDHFIPDIELINDKILKKGAGKSRIQFYVIAAAFFGVMISGYWILKQNSNVSVTTYPDSTQKYSNMNNSDSKLTTDVINENDSDASSIDNISSKNQKIFIPNNQKVDTCFATISKSEHRVEKGAFLNSEIDNDSPKNYVSSAITKKYTFQIAVDIDGQENCAKLSLIVINTSNIYDIENNLWFQFENESDSVKIQIYCDKFKSDIISIQNKNRVLIKLNFHQ